MNDSALPHGFDRMLSFPRLSMGKNPEEKFSGENPA
jgi:hypothetical protein